MRFTFMKRLLLAASLATLPAVSGCGDSALYRSPRPGAASPSDPPADSDEDEVIDCPEGECEELPSWECVSHPTFNCQDLYAVISYDACTRTQSVSACSLDQICVGGACTLAGTLALAADGPEGPGIYLSEHLREPFLVVQMPPDVPAPLTLAWEPSGRALLFSVPHPTEGGSDLWRAVLPDADSPAPGSLTQLTSGSSYDTSPSVSSDGEWYVYATNDGEAGSGRFYLRFLRANLQETASLVPPDTDLGRYDQPDWCPDGSLMFRSTVGMGGDNIWHASGPLEEIIHGITTLTELTPNPWADSTPDCYALAEDPTIRVSYTSWISAARKEDMAMLTLGGGGPAVLERGGVQRNPVVDPHTGLIALKYELVPDEVRLVLMNPSGDVLSQLGPELEVNSVAWKPFLP